MSYRIIPTSRDGLVRLLRDILDRLERIESGNVFGNGRISFGNVIQIGDVELAVTNGVGNARILTFRNLKNGATSVINL